MNSRRSLWVRYHSGEQKGGFTGRCLLPLGALYLWRAFSPLQLKILPWAKLVYTLLLKKIAEVWEINSHPLPVCQESAQLKMNGRSLSASVSACPITLWFFLLHHEDSQPPPPCPCLPPFRIELILQEIFNVHMPPLHRSSLRVPVILDLNAFFISYKFIAICWFHSGNTHTKIIHKEDETHF